MDDAADELTTLAQTEAEIKELLGLFDTPAFARRGQNLEYALDRLDQRCRAQRSALLEMVRLRLRQWAGSVTGPDAWPVAFAAPIDDLWPLSGAEAPTWSDRPASPRRQRTVARDLVASVERFNSRWARLLHELNLEPVNRQIDHFNRYYLLEKECAMGSARLAARHFAPKPRLAPETLLAQHPLLPVPELVS